MEFPVHHRTKVLCISDYYSPGFMGGGPIRTLENMVDRIGDQIEFWIFTRDRDLGARSPYQDVPINEWTKVGKAFVYYASPEQFGATGLKIIHDTNNFDTTYLNSFFSFNGTIIPLLLSKYSRKHKNAIILAPRGEFSKGALKIKHTKKSTYIALTKIIKLCNGIHWQASSQREADDIVRVLPNAKGNISIAPDLISLTPTLAFHPESPPKCKGELRVAFISRISAKKNLTYLLESLKKAKSKILLSIYGPIEDADYWNECKTKIQALPDNVTAEHIGSLKPDQVMSAFARHDLFAFPTLGENFGHVIFESIQAGTPVLISDQTPWRQDHDGAITIRSLNNIEAWTETLDQFAQLDSVQQKAIRNATTAYANRYIVDNNSKSANLAMFERAISEYRRLTN